MVRLLGAALVAGAALWGCAGAPLEPLTSPARPGPAPPAVAVPAPAGTAAAMPHYRCEQGLDFRVRFGEDSALIESPKRGSEVLLRDAGGVTPQQTVYSNARLRAEFGLGAAGREANLRYLPEPQVVRCVLD